MGKAITLAVESNMSSTPDRNRLNPVIVDVVEPPNEGANRYLKWYLVALLTLIAALDYADRTAIAAALPLLRNELHMTPFTLGLAGSAFFWIYAGCSPLAGYLADRLCRKKVIVWSCFLWSLVIVATGFVQTSWQMVAVRAALGLAECAYVPAAVAMTATYHHSKTRAFAMGIQFAGYNAGVVVGATFVGHLSDYCGWRPPFWILGAAGIGFAALAQMSLPSDASSRSPAKLPGVPMIRAFRTLISVPTFNILLLESTIVSAGVWIFLFWLPLYFKDTFQLSLTAAAAAGTVGLQSAATVASLLGGHISDRLAQRHLKWRMLFQFFCFILAIPFLVPFFRHPSLPVVSASIFFFGFFRTLATSGECAIMCDVLPEEVWATGIGLTNASNSAANAVGVLITGYLLPRFGLAGIFGSLWTTVAAAALLVFVAYRYYLPADLARAALRSRPSIQ